MSRVNANPATLTNADDWIELPAASRDGAFGVEITGTWLGTLVFEQLIDPAGSAASADAYSLPLAAASPVNSATANGHYIIPVQGATIYRVRRSVATSGGAVVLLTRLYGPVPIPQSATLSGALGAGENHIGAVGGNTFLGSVSPTCATPGLSAGNIIFNGTEISGALRVSGGTGVLESVTVIDRDDQGIALDLIFTDGSASFGVLGSNGTAADSLGDKVLGKVSVVAADYVDLGGFRVATVDGINLVVKGNATTSLWVAGVAAGSGTFTASGLTVKPGILQD